MWEGKGMTEDEIDLIIGKYMGWEFHQDRWLLRSGSKFIEAEPSVPNYCKSLDALIPVVEKLEMHLILDFEPNRVLVWGVRIEDSASVKPSPNLAVATACAKVIQELK